MFHKNTEFVISDYFNSQSVRPILLNGQLTVIASFRDVRYSSSRPKLQARIGCGTMMTDRPELSFALIMQNISDPKEALNVTDDRGR